MNPCLTFDEAVQFACQHPVCWLATSVNDQPHVRGMLLWFADASGFYFHTGSSKLRSRSPRVPSLRRRDARGGLHH